MRDANFRLPRAPRSLGVAAGMFTGPAAALERLREQPIWFPPLLLASLFSVGVNLYVLARIGLARMMRAAIEASAAFDPDQALQAALARKNMIVSIQSISTAAGTFLTALAVAGFLWLVLTAAGEDAAFRKVLAVVSHVTMLAAVLKGSMLAVAVTAMGDAATIDLRNPLATNLAFFLRPHSSAAQRLLASLDLIVMMQLALLAFGLAKISGRMSLKKSCFLVAAPWGGYIVATAFLPI